MSQTKAQLISDLVQALNFTGTASAPTNGAFLSAANTLALATNSAQRLTIDSSGKVGIGISSSIDRSLHIVNNSGAIVKMEANYSGSVTGIEGVLTASGANRYVVGMYGKVVNTSSTESDVARIRFYNEQASPTSSDSPGYITFDTTPDGSATPTERLRIDSSGNVGIGTSPEEIFHIKGPTETIGSRDGVLLQHSTASNAADNGLPLVWSGYISASNTNYGLASICGRKENSTDNNGAAYLQFGTGSDAGAIAEKMRIKSNGNVGIGTTSPQRLLHLQSASSPGILLQDTTQNSQLQLLAQNANVIVGTNSSHPLTFTINNNEKARIHTGGELVIGHTTTTTISNGENPFLQVKGTDSRAGASFIRHSADASSGGLYLGKSRNGTIGSNTIVQNGDELGRITFSGDDGTDVHTVAAEIKSFVDGTPGANDMPGRLGFFTCPDGSAAAVERMRLNSVGALLLGTATSNNTARLQVTTPNQVVATFESTGNDPQIYLGDDMSSPTDNALIFGYDRADNRGYLTIAGDADTALTINNGSLVGVNTSAPVEHFGVAGNIRLVTPTGSARRITSKDSGSYNVGTTGGSAIVFNRFSDGGGASDEIFFETHHQGVRHDTSVTITKEGYLSKPKTPFFQAFGTANNQTYTNTVITLENVKYNVGGFWKTTAGTGQHQRFTAPIAGLYLFMFGFFPNGSNTCRIQLKLNGTDQTNPYINGLSSAMGAGFPQPSGAQILYCNANDYVEVAVNGTFTTYDGHAGFSGVFLA